MSATKCTKRKQYGDRTYKPNDIFRIYCNYLTVEERSRVLDAFRNPLEICEYTVLPNEAVIAEIDEALAEIDVSRKTVHLLLDPTHGFAVLVDRVTQNFLTSMQLLDNRTTQLEIIGRQFTASMQGQDLTADQKLIVTETLDDLIDAILTSQTESEVGLIKFDKLENWKKDAIDQINSLLYFSEIIGDFLKYTNADSGLFNSISDKLERLKTFFKEL